MRWKKEKAGYEIYNPTKIEVRISKRLPGLQTCFRAELMAIHKTLRLITTKYTNEPAHIFTDCLNCIYVLNTHIKHPTQHNNHADKTILTSMVDMLKKRTQPTTISKVKAHTNIEGNEQADQLAKSGAKKRYRFATKSYEFAHTTPFFFQKDIWPGPNKRPDKGPVRCLQTYITKHDRETNLKIMAEQFPNISKWTMNPNIDNDVSNKFWDTPTITDSQKTSILKFRTGQYMGNARKQLFFGIERFPTITCPICNSLEADTWLHVLLKCNQHHIHALRTKRHNKAVWELRKLIISAQKSRCYILMNAGTFNNNPQENTIPTWLLPCACNQNRCHCNARFKPDLLCITDYHT
jgi:ribonuclease HI